MKKVSNCRCCNSNQLLLYLDLDKQPLANSYHKGELQKKYPLEVLLCQNCFHSQLSIVVEPDLMFKNYLYVSGTTETFRKHCQNLAVDAVKRFSNKPLSVLDIGCNDGTLLKYFRKLSCEITGIEPAKNLRETTKKENIPVFVDYWSLKLAKKLQQKFDIITATNVFAHVDDPFVFLEACSYSMKPGGIIILEFPYATELVKNNEFDTVYHEHLSYFLVNSFKALIARTGLYIADILETSIHGGSIRFFLKRGKVTSVPKISNYIAAEKKKGLFDVKTYVKFAKRVSKHKKKMIKLLKSAKNHGRKTIGYGASAKGNTMLNYFKIDLDYIVDDNPIKWEYLTPGRNIPITSPQELGKEPQLLEIVILAWNFYNEIAKKIVQIRGKNTGDRYLLYIPTVRSLTLD